MSVEFASPRVEECAADAARLVAEAFTAPAIEMNEAFLRWVMGRSGPEVDAHDALTAVGRLDGKPVAFLGAPVRTFNGVDEAFQVAIPSFVAVAPGFGGRGIARAGYVHLLDQVRARGLPALTFAIDGSRGAALVESMYPQCGFAGHPLPLMPLFGAVRAPPFPGEDVEWRPGSPVLALDRSPATRRHLLADPRGALDLEVAGAIAVTAWQRMESGRRPVLLLEHLPEPLTAGNLATAVAAALRLGAAHSRQLLVPNLPDGAHELGRQAGLRRLPGTSYRGWLWTPTTTHPAARCSVTTHPIL